MLSQDDIGVILEALKVWEATVVESDVSGTTNSVMEMLFNGTASKKNMEGVLKSGFLEHLGKKQLREETSILIKAKLIQMRDKIVAQDAMKGIEV